MRCHPSHLLFGALISGLITLLVERDGAADGVRRGLILLDSLSVLIGEGTSDEADSIPLLLSDLELEFSLFVARKPGRAATSALADDEMRNEARRSAVLVKILARQARRLGGAPDRELVDALVGELTERIGGADAMRLLLGRFGSDEKDLRSWAEDAILAAEQIRYVEEQVDLPFEKDLVVETKKASTVSKWLEEIISRSRVRIIR